MLRCCCLVPLWLELQRHTAEVLPHASQRLMVGGREGALPARRIQHVHRKAHVAVQLTHSDRHSSRSVHSAAASRAHRTTRPLHRPGGLCNGAATAAGWVQYILDVQVEYGQLCADVLVVCRVHHPHSVHAARLAAQLHAALAGEGRIAGQQKAAGRGGEEQGMPVGQSELLGEGGRQQWKEVLVLVAVALLDIRIVGDVGGGWAVVGRYER